MPLKRREIVRKVKALGGWEDTRKSGTGHRTLFRRDPANPTGRPLVATLQYHGSNADFPNSVVKAIREKLHLDPAHGVSDEQWDGA